jgi:hypothetical protein
MKTTNKILITAVAAFAIAFLVFLVINLNNMKNLITDGLTNNGFANASGSVIKNEKTVPDFNSIEIHENFHVKLINDSLNKVEIEADKAVMPYIKVEVKNHKLFVEMAEAGSEIRDKNNAEIITIHYHNLISVTGSENVSINSGSEIKADTFNLNLSENANVGLKLNAKKLYCNLNENASSVLSGNANNAKIILSENSNLTAGKLIINDCKIVASENSTAIINAKNTLDKTVSNQAIVSYSGNPKMVKL